MNGHYRGVVDDPDDEDDDEDCEMAGLLSNHNGNGGGEPRKERYPRKGVPSRSKRAYLKPLQIMHSSTKVRLHDSKSSTVACQTGFAVMLLSTMLGVWIWSGRTIDQQTTIQRWHTLKLNNIEHWCLDKSERCQCSNPLEPKDRIGHRTWQQAHDGNIRDAITSSRRADIVLLGDSIIEGWRGMSFGMPVPEKAPNIKVFESLFRESKGADFEGMALGIAGDKTSNLLWRIQNGEIPPDLHPSIWWILIGTNDFGRDLPHCSPEVVVMGIKRVVEEMKKLRPGSTIVVNSILPRAEDDLKGRLIDPKHEDRVTVWQGILEVNRQLRDYCAKVRNVVYYDATKIFVRQDNGTKGVDGMYIPEDLMYDYLHPTAEGYKKWGTEIIATAHDVLEASQDKGRLFLSATWWDKQIDVSFASPKKSGKF